MECIWFTWKGFGRGKYCRGGFWKKTSEASPKLYRATSSQLWDFCVGYCNQHFEYILFWVNFSIHSRHGNYITWVRESRGCAVELWEWSLRSDSSAEYLQKTYWGFTPWAIKILSQEFLTQEFLEVMQCVLQFLFTIYFFGKYWIRDAGQEESLI